MQSQGLRAGTGSGPTAEEGQTRVRLAEATDLIRGALRMRLRPACPPPVMTEPGDERAAAAAGGAPAGSCRRDAGTAGDSSPGGPAVPAVIRLCTEIAPIRPAPICGQTAHGGVGRILPGGVPGHRGV